MELESHILALLQQETRKCDLCAEVMNNIGYTGDDPLVVTEFSCTGCKAILTHRLGDKDRRMHSSLSQWLERLRREAKNIKDGS